MNNIHKNRQFLPEQNGLLVCSVQPWRLAPCSPQRGLNKCFKLVGWHIWDVLILNTQSSLLSSLGWIGTYLSWGSWIPTALFGGRYRCWQYESYCSAQFVDLHSAEYWRHLKSISIHFSCKLTLVKKLVVVFPITHHDTLLLCDKRCHLWFHN